MPSSPRDHLDGLPPARPGDRGGDPLRVAVLGSTGSIGQSTIDVIEASRGRLVPALLAAWRSTASLLEQARRLRPRWVVVGDPAAAAAITAGDLPTGTGLAVGPEALDELVADPAIDRVVSAIVGAAGLRSTWAAIEAGKTVALANKETLVMAGPLVMRRAAETGSRIIPVDSEHSAIHQALACGRPAEVERLVLTASGGPSGPAPGIRSPASRPRRRCGIRPGRWVRRSRSTPPR
jgi:1-deoxy-D-xylulose-5-phosphate reductoisomerase